MSKLDDAHIFIPLDPKTNEMIRRRAETIELNNEAKSQFLFYEEWLDNAPSENPSINLTNEEWEALRPKVGRDEFIRQLHERVLALEIALAEKEQIRISVK